MTVPILDEPTAPAADRGVGGGPVPRGPWRVVVILLGVLALVALGSVLIGSRMVPVDAVLDASHPDRVVIDARITRTVLGIMVGAALGLAGACMQGLTRNPLADPGILGVNAGAAFAIVLGIAFLGIDGLSTYIWFAFAGAAVAAVAVHAIAAFGRDGATPAKLAIAGAAFGAALTSWTIAVQMLDRASLEAMRRWQVGTIGGRDWGIVADVAPFLVVGGVLALSIGRVLNNLALGDDLARGLGARTARDRVVVGVAVVLLAGAATAVAGPIAFVGLVVPHAVRRLVGSDYRRILPLSALAGAILTVAADTVGRVVLPPTEVQVGVMTAAVGVPFFVWLIRRGRLGGL